MLGPSFEPPCSTSADAGAFRRVLYADETDTADFACSRAHPYALEWPAQWPYNLAGETADKEAGSKEGRRLRRARIEQAHARWPATRGKQQGGGGCEEQHTYVCISVADVTSTISPRWVCGNFLLQEKTV